MSYGDNLKIDGDKQISDYILQDEIGSGGFAKVVQGIHIPTGEKVAIKIMDKIQLFSDPLNLRRVKSEISLLKIVRHKNIIKLYEVIETPQKIYLIMEYCEGGELFDYIVKKQNLTERQSCFFFHEIIDALEYLHSINIVHRDIKPENLLIDKINKKLSLKLIDFGISSTYNMQSLLITPCGTASYAPPEMHKGEKYYGLLTDVWSAGVVLYAMVFGYLPFCEDDEDTNINNIIEGNYEIPSSASPELYDLLLHLLDINPITRYDIDQIKMHPWYNLISSDSNRPGLIIGYHIIPVDERIINICKSYGYDENKVRDSVINNNYDNNSSIYYIVLNKMKIMGIGSVSDLNSIEYLNYISDPNNIFFNKKNSISKKNDITDNNKKENNKDSNNINNEYITNNKIYKNISPFSNIQFTINCHLNNKKNNVNKNVKNKVQKKNNIINKSINNINKNINNINKNIFDKKINRNNSTNKNNHKNIISSNKMTKQKERKNVTMPENINMKSYEEKNKKQSKIIFNNNLVFQTNRTFSIISKYDIKNNDFDQNYNIKKNESFNKKLTDDIKEKILKLKNPKINDKKRKVNEALLKLQLKIKKNFKNNIHNRKIGQKLSIFNKERKRHTIIHNRNASATPNRYNKNKNTHHININYINNSINVNNIYIQKIREQSTSPSKKHMKNNSSIIKYQRINKNHNHKINSNCNNKIDSNLIINKTKTLDNIEINTNDSPILNKSSKKNYYKNKHKIKARLSGQRNNFKNVLKNIDKDIICKSARNRNSSLTNRRNPKEIPPSIHFLSFLNKQNNLSANKRLSNKSNIIIKNSYKNDYNKKNIYLHTSFNCNIKDEKYEKYKNKILNSFNKNKIKKNSNVNEIKENCSTSFVKNNKLLNYISPIHKKNKRFFELSKKKNKNKNMPISLALNTTRGINHKKCSSMKYIENNSDSFNYDSAFIQKNNHNKNKSFREREIKREKIKNQDNYLLSRKKSCKKRKIINLSFKNKNNKEGNINYKSNYILKKNIYFPKKYNGPIDFKNIAIGYTGIDICDEIEAIIKKKKNINLHRVNPFKIVCRKNLENVEINLNLISGNIINNNMDNSFNILNYDTNDLEVKYNNTFTGFYRNEKKNDGLNWKYNKKIKERIFYINIFSQKEKKGNNNKTLFEFINKAIYNKFNLVKKNIG